MNKAFRCARGLLLASEQPWKNKSANIAPCLTEVTLICEVTEKLQAQIWIIVSLQLYRALNTRYNAPVMIMFASQQGKLFTSSTGMSLGIKSHLFSHPGVLIRTIIF
jgi:hypothetical protein